jgi:hypothetical protein
MKSHTIIVLPIVLHGPERLPHLRATTKITSAGFEVLTVVIMKSSIFWDITPYSPLKIDQRFGGTCLLQLQG